MKNNIFLNNNKIQIKTKKTIILLKSKFIKFESSFINKSVIKFKLIRKKPDISKEREINDARLTISSEKPLIFFLTDSRFVLN